MYIELIAKDLPCGLSFTLPQWEEGEFFKWQRLILFLFEVDDVDAEYARLQAAGLHIYQEMQDKP